MSVMVFGNGGMKAIPGKWTQGLLKSFGLRLEEGGVNEGGQNGKMKTYIAPRHPLLLDCFCWTGCWYCIYKIHQLAVCSVFESFL